MPKANSKAAPNQAILLQLTKLIDGGQAHATFDQAVAGFPVALRGKRPPNVPYSAWQLLEHIRIAQRDILDWADNSDRSYKSMNWPDDYWPRSSAPPTPGAWNASIRAIHRDQRAFKKLLTAKGASLTRPFPWGNGKSADGKSAGGHNLLRQALLLADHNAYHVGEIIFLRRLLGCWK
jgi:hypothetical protein